MKLIKTFLRTLFLSLTSPAYYADVIKSKLSFSMKYFFLINLLVALVVVAKVLVPVSAFDLQGAVNNVASVFPSDLRIEVSQGELAINKPLPYAIPMPEFMKDETSQHPTQNLEHQDDWTHQLKNLVVFDSDKNVQNMRSFEKYQTVALVTETSIYSRKSSSTNEISAFPIPEDAEGLQLDSDQIAIIKQAFLEMPAVKNKWYVPVIGAILLLIVVPFMILGKLITLLVYSLFIYFLVRFLQQSVFHNYSYSLSKVFQVSLHSVTLVVLIKMIAEFLNRGELLEGWGYFAVFALWTGIVLWKASEILMMNKPENVSPSSPVPAKKKSASKKK